MVRCATGQLFVGVRQPQRFHALIGVLHEVEGCPAFIAVFVSRVAWRSIWSSDLRSSLFRVLACVPALCGTGDMGGDLERSDGNALLARCAGQSDGVNFGAPAVPPPEPGAIVRPLGYPVASRSLSSGRRKDAGLLRATVAGGGNPACDCPLP